jgi:vacuolar protein sorting-associated protein 13A/C
VAFYLNKYLGKYLDGLDAQSLAISVWNGDVSLRNLTLKPEALQDLELPITVRAGILGKLTLKVGG